MRTIAPLQPLVDKKIVQGGGFATTSLDIITSTRGGVVMNMAERISGIRKARGMSQEELADKIGVSRQAVSKWESGQSLPEIEKIILLSNYFGVSTDYLLKGIEPAVSQGAAVKEKPDAMIYAMLGTAWNFLGLITAVTIWYEKQVATAIALGLFLMIAGCTAYGTGMIMAKPETRNRAKRVFWRINIWLLSFIPLSLVYNFLFGWKGLVPYPLFGYPRTAYGLFWVVYAMLGILVNLRIYRMQRGLEANPK